jgi:predicted ATP-grasp superfamily ATP-dependent carboligase
VLGDIDLVRPLGFAGIPCAVVARPGDPARYSRFTRTTIEWIDPWRHAEQLVDALVAFAGTQPEQPVLFYQTDDDLLMASRFRDRLREGYRLLIPEATLVEDLVDKARFVRLAEELGLPVPSTRVLSPSSASPDSSLDLRYPLVIKPLTRRAEHWASVSGAAKAVHVKTPEDLHLLWPSIVDAGQPLLAQEAIPGPETRIESYHAYVDAGGSIVAEFTGCKLRTYPAVYGYSTALEITENPEVTELGRRLVEALSFRGVLKCDFKRTPSGELALLEINPRYTLWHHLAAKAGLNVPAIVYDDLTGRPRGQISRARPGTQWCYHLHDARAARETGMGLAGWLRWVAGCEAKSAASLTDPLPFVRGVVWGALSRRIPVP